MVTFGRVARYLQKIQRKDGALGKMGAQASFDQLEAEFKRQSDLASREFASKAVLDQACVAHDGTTAKLMQAQVEMK
jgi:multidrug resistance efflux pump